MNSLFSSVLRFLRAPVARCIALCLLISSFTHAQTIGAATLTGRVQNNAA